MYSSIYNHLPHTISLRPSDSGQWSDVDSKYLVMRTVIVCFPPSVFCGARRQNLMRAVSICVAQREYY